MLLLRIIWRSAARWGEKNSILQGGKIALLFRGLNMHLLRITLEHSDTAREKLSTGEAAVKNSETHIRILGSAHFPGHRVGVKISVCLLTYAEFCHKK